MISSYYGNVIYNFAFPYYQKKIIPIVSEDDQEITIISAYEYLSGPALMSLGIAPGEDPSTDMLQSFKSNTSRNISTYEEFKKVFLYLLKGSHPTANYEDIFLALNKNLRKFNIEPTLDAQIKRILDLGGAKEYIDIEEGILFIDSVEHESTSTYFVDLILMNKKYRCNILLNHGFSGSLRINIWDSTHNIMIGPLFLGVIDYKNNIIYPAPNIENDFASRISLGVKSKNNTDIILTCVPSSYLPRNVADRFNTRHHKLVKDICKSDGYLNGSELLIRTETVPKKTWGKRNRLDLDVDLETIAFNKDEFLKLSNGESKTIILLDDIVTSGATFVANSIIIYKNTKILPKCFAFGKTYYAKTIKEERMNAFFGENDE